MFWNLLVQILSWNLNRIFIRLQILGLLLIASKLFFLTAKADELSSEESYREYFPQEIPLLSEKSRFDFIIIGSSASGLIAARSILEKHFWSLDEEVEILILDKGREYEEEEEEPEKERRNKAKGKSRKEKPGYSPLLDRNKVNVQTTEDGFAILNSEVEGGRTSYGSTPFVPENVYSGEYYKSLGLGLSSRKLQESYEYVKSVGDLIQPNIRTSWVIALERAFNETGTFPVEGGADENSAPEDSLFEDSSFEIREDEGKQAGKFSIFGEREYNDQEQLHFPDENEVSLEKVSDNESSEFFTSSHMVPYAFLTHGFRRGFQRRSGARLLKINPNLMDGKRVTKKVNFLVERIIFSVEDQQEYSGKGGGNKFAECVEGRSVREDQSKETVRFCIKPGVGKIILSAGALNTPMILQRSGVGSRENIKVSNPKLEKPVIENDFVGKGLRDHPSLSVFGFFKGQDSDNFHYESSEALFSRKSFGSYCRNKNERDDILQGCESVTISEFEGFNIFDTLGEERVIKRECLSLIRGVTIRIPNPYSEGEIVWDEVKGRPRIKLRLLEDLNDILIMESAVRRLIRLFRSVTISSLLVPSSNSRRAGWWGGGVNGGVERRRIDLGGLYSNVTSMDSIFERCSLDVLAKVFPLDEQDELREKGNEENSNIRKGPEAFSEVVGPGERASGILKGEGQNSGGLPLFKERLKKHFSSEGGRGSQKETVQGGGNAIRGGATSPGVPNELIPGVLGLRRGEPGRDESDNKGESNIWKTLPFIIPRFPTHPSKFEDFLKRNVRSGNEFVGTTAVGQVVETECFRVMGTKNLYILDEGVLSKHTSSSPLGTSMVLSRYAIMSILENKC
ncbi:Glucose-methanol-choline oxidoreductase [Cryptosporidium felis]|nr:Glucose-methanol-choline oxidoreductase [Cryptosporidium felis]